MTLLDRVPWPTQAGPWIGLAASVGVAVLLFAEPSLLGASLAASLGATAVLAGGVLSLAVLVSRSLERDLDDPVILALLPSLGVPILARRLAGVGAFELPLAFQAGLLFEALSVATGLVVLLAAGRWRSPPDAGWRDPAVVVGGLGGALLVGALAWLSVLVPPPPSGVLVVLAVTAAAVAALLALQRSLGRRFWPGGGYASGPALFVSGAQLLDGIVSYLAVADPLGLLNGGFTEQVALSAWLIETTGPGFPLTKWAIALAAVHYIDGAPRV